MLHAIVAVAALVVDLHTRLMIAFIVVLVFGLVLALIVLIVLIILIVLVALITVFVLHGNSSFL